MSAEMFIVSGDNKAYEMEPGHKVWVSRISPEQYFKTKGIVTDE